jgi:carboxypeptidase C (cathepsin A)
MYLPSYAAVAWYHKKLSPDLQADFDKTINAARAFTADEYVPALQKGAAITPEQRAHLIKQISAFTGLTADLIERSNLRINPGEFEKQLLGDGRQIIGRFDGRITGFDPANHGGPEFDPSLSYYLPAYASAFNQYVRDDLKYENDLPYEVLSNSVHPWSMKDEEGNPLYVTDDLQDALLQHPRLRVQFVSGYYDLATPFYSADYTINRMNLDPAARANVTHLYYPSGHMIYHNRAAAKEFAGAMEKFVTGGK